MPSTDPTPLDPSEILTNQRLGTAISTLADPDKNPDGLVAHLDEHERHVIRDALNRSRHPLVAVAQYLLDQWDRLDPDDRVAGLLLFAEIVNRPHRQRAVSQGGGKVSDACASCDADTRLTAQGLCESCRDDLRFVVRPAAHREAYRRRVAAEAGFREEMERLGVVIITSVPGDNSLWICDLCSSQIPVDGEYTLIPLLGSHALCTPCATTIPYWPDGWTHPTPRACRCGACQSPLLRTLITEPPNRHPTARQRGIER